MGTNYYIDTPPSCGGKCDRHCHGEEVHLGKSSMGWSFTFKGYPDPENAPEAVTWPVTDYESWLKLLDLGPVRDEYHAPVSRDELLTKIQQKRGGRHHDPHAGAFRDADGNDFTSWEFC